MRVKSRPNTAQGEQAQLELQFKTAGVGGKL